MVNIDPYHAGLGLFIAATTAFGLHLLIFKPAKPVRAKMALGLAMLMLVASIVMWPITNGGALNQLLFAGLLGFLIARQLYDPSCREAR